MGVRKVNENLELLGAYFINSTFEKAWPKCIRKIMKKAKNEMTTTLDEKQFDLYEKAGGVECTSTREHIHG
jgi:Tfp pilus assembly ATPase PilU